MWQKHVPSLKWKFVLLDNIDANRVIAQSCLLSCLEFICVERFTLIFILTLCTEMRWYSVCKTISICWLLDIFVWHCSCYYYAIVNTLYFPQRWTFYCYRNLLDWLKFVKDPLCLFKWLSDNLLWKNEIAVLLNSGFIMYMKEELSEIYLE